MDPNTLPMLVYMTLLDLTCIGIVSIFVRVFVLSTTTIKLFLVQFRSQTTIPFFPRGYSDQHLAYAERGLKTGVNALKNGPEHIFSKGYIL